MPSIPTRESTLVDREQARPYYSCCTAFVMIPWSSRMLKKSASFVLASFTPSAYQRRFSEVGSAAGAFLFSKTHCKGERPTGSAVCTSSPLHSLGPCWEKILSILRSRVLLSQTSGPLNVWQAGIMFPQPASTLCIRAVRPGDSQMHRNALLAIGYDQLSAWATMLFIVPALAAQRLYTLYQEQRQLTDDLTDANEQLERANLSFAAALVATLDARDQYTAGHSAAVAIYSRDIAQRMGLDDSEQQKAHLAGLVHDIGKIGLPPGLLEKAGPLTLEERRVMQTPLRDRRADSRECGHLQRDRPCCSSPS